MQDFQALPNPGTSSLVDPLVTQLPETGRLVGLLPKLAAVGKFTMGGVAGFVAWQGGTYLLGKLFSPPDTPAGEIWDLNRWSLGDKGTVIGRQCYVSSACTNQTSIAYKLTDPGRIYTSTTTQTDFYYCVGGTQYTTPASVVGAIPQSARVVLTYTEDPIGRGSCGNFAWQHFSVIDDISPGEFSPWNSPQGPDEGGSQIGSITSTPCTTNWTCPTSSNVQQKIIDALNSGDYPTLSQWLDHEADPQNFPDPTVPETDNSNNHKCDLSTPTYENPGGSTDPSPYTPRISEAFHTTYRPTTEPDAPDPYLRWGSTSWGGGTLDSWPGWGWRHIQAKHGWSYLDEAATREALLNPVEPPEQAGSSLTFIGPDYTKGTAVCDRIVVVEFGQGTGDPQGIITSYGDYLGEAP